MSRIDCFKLCHLDAMRTLDAASQEDEDDVQELWAKLIVKAATASDKPSINKVHIEILRF